MAHTEKSSAHDGPKKDDVVNKLINMQWKRPQPYSPETSPNQKTNSSQHTLYINRNSTTSLKESNETHFSANNLSTYNKPQDDKRSRTYSSGIENTPPTENRCDARQFNSYSENTHRQVSRPIINNRESSKPAPRYEDQTPSYSISNHLNGSQFNNNRTCESGMKTDLLHRNCQYYFRKIPPGSYKSHEFYIPPKEIGTYDFAKYADPDGDESERRIIEEEKKQNRNKPSYDPEENTETSEMSDSKSETAGKVTRPGYALYALRKPPPPKPDPQPTMENTIIPRIHQDVDVILNQMDQFRIVSLEAESTSVLPSLPEADLTFGKTNREKVSPRLSGISTSPALPHAGVVRITNNMEALPVRNDPSLESMAADSQWMNENFIPQPSTQAWLNQSQIRPTPESIMSAYPTERASQQLSRREDLSVLSMTPAAFAGHQSMAPATLASHLQSSRREDLQVQPQQFMPDNSFDKFNLQNAVSMASYQSQMKMANPPQGGCENFAINTAAASMTPYSTESQLTGRGGTLQAQSMNLNLQNPAEFGGSQVYDRGGGNGHAQMQNPQSMAAYSTMESQFNARGETLQTQCTNLMQLQHQNAMTPSSEFVIANQLYDRNVQMQNAAPSATEFARNRMDAGGRVSSAGYMENQQLPSRYHASNQMSENTSRDVSENFPPAAAPYATDFIASEVENQRSRFRGEDFSQQCHANMYQNAAPSSSIANEVENQRTRYRSEDFPQQFDANVYQNPAPPSSYSGDQSSFGHREFASVDNYGGSYPAEACTTNNFKNQFQNSMHYSVDEADRHQPFQQVQTCFATSSYATELSMSNPNRLQNSMAAVPYLEGGTDKSQFAHQTFEQVPTCPSVSSYLADSPPRNNPVTVTYSQEFMANKMVSQQQPQEDCGNFVEGQNQYRSGGGFVQKRIDNLRNQHASIPVSFPPQFAGENEDSQALQPENDADGAYGRMRSPVSSVGSYAAEYRLDDRQSYSIPQFVPSRPPPSLEGREGAEMLQNSMPLNSLAPPYNPSMNRIENQSFQDSREACANQPINGNDRQQDGRLSAEWSNRSRGDGSDSMTIQVKDDLLSPNVSFCVENQMCN